MHATRVTRRLSHGLAGSSGSTTSQASSLGSAQWSPGRPGAQERETGPTFPASTDCRPDANSTCSFLKAHARDGRNGRAAARANRPPRAREDVGRRRRTPGDAGGRCDESGRGGPTRGPRGRETGARRTEEPRPPPRAAGGRGRTGSAFRGTERRRGRRPGRNSVLGSGGRGRGSGGLREDSSEKGGTKKDQNMFPEDNWSPLPWALALA